MSAAQDALTYLEALHGARPQPSVIVVTPTDRGGRFARSHFVKSPEDALHYVLGAVDVYVRITPIGSAPAKGRGTADDAIALPAVWAELDVNGAPGRDGRPKAGAFPTVEAAVDVAGAVLEPSLVVGSGGGAHAYWLLDQPLELRSDEDRDHAARLVTGFQQRLRQEARERFDAGLDSTQDLARVLRPPGSLNGKGPEPRPVVLLDDGGRRYSLDAIAAQAVSVDAAPAGSDDPAGGRTVDQLLAELPALGRIVRRDAKVPGDGTGHAWDFYLCCEAIRCGCGDDELAALIAHNRRANHDPHGKAERGDYIERTITAARRSARDERADPAALISRRWGLAADPIVSGQTVGDVASGSAVVVLERRSGARLRLSRLGDLFDPRAHTRAVSLAARSVFPPLTNAQATEIAQLVTVLCGGEDADPLEEARGWVLEFIAHAGTVLQAVVAGRRKSRWEMLEELAEAEVTLKDNRNAAARTAVMRDSEKNELWLPAGALKEHSGARLSWGQFAAVLLEAGWRHVDLDVREPTTRDNKAAARRFHRNFYVGQH